MEIPADKEQLTSHSADKTFLDCSLRSLRTGFGAEQGRASPLALSSPPRTLARSLASHSAGQPSSSVVQGRTRQPPAPLLRALPPLAFLTFTCNSGTPPSFTSPPPLSPLSHSCNYFLFSSFLLRNMTKQATNNRIRREEEGKRRLKEKEKREMRKENGKNRR